MTIFDDDGAELRRVLKAMRDEQDRRHEALLAELAKDRAAAEPEPFGQAHIARAYADGPTPSETREQRRDRRRSRQKTDRSQR